MGEVIDFNTGLSHKEPYPDVVYLLEHALSRAKSGEVVAASIVLCDDQGRFVTAWQCGPDDDTVFYNAMVAGSSHLVYALNKTADMEDLPTEPDAA